MNFFFLFSIRSKNPMLMKFENAAGADFQEIYYCLSFVFSEDALTEFEKNLARGLTDSDLKIYEPNVQTDNVETYFVKDKHGKNSAVLLMDYYDYAIKEIIIRSIPVENIPNVAMERLK